MDQIDDWLRQTLEQELGFVVEDKISTLQNLDPAMLDSLSGDGEVAQDVCCCIEMVEFRGNLCQDAAALYLERDYSVFHDTTDMNDRAAKGRHHTVSKCSSVDASPRNDKSQELFTTGNKHARNAHHSAGQHMQALEVLLRVPVNDIVGSANWPQLQQELCESLRDDNWVVFEQVLRVLCRLSSSVAFSPVREGFLSLLEGLTLYYLTRHLHQELPSTLHGIQLDNAVHQRIILISQCVLQVLKEVPGKWIRYGEKRTQEIVDNFVDLLSMHTHHHRTPNANQSKDILYPFHIFSLLDPEAKWCAGVMHAAFGRTILMKCVMKSTSLIRFIAEEVVIWLESQLKLSDGVVAIYETGGNGNINGNVIKLTLFLHCISLLQMFVDCDRGHLVFPVLTSIQEEPVSVYFLLLKIIEFLNKVSNAPNINFSESLMKKLEDVSASLILSRGTRILTGSCTELVYLLLESPKESQNKTNNFSLHSHNINILCKISESPLANKWMLGQPVRKTREGISRPFGDLRLSLSSANSSGRESVLTHRTACVARRVAKATAALVRDRNSLTASEAASPVCQLLSLSEKLFKTPEGYLLLDSCEGQLIPLAGHLYIHVRNLMYNSDLGLLSIQRILEDFLMGMILTPMGFMAVCGVDGVVKNLVAVCMESPVQKYEEARFLQLLHLSASIPCIKLHMYWKSLVKHALNKLWTAHDIKSEWAWQEAKSNFMAIVLGICSTPSTVSQMLDDFDEQDDNSSESTLVEEIEPLSFKELLARGLQSSSETTYLQEISLDILHALVHNIDIIFVLQEKLKLTACLQRMLLDAKVKETGSELTVQPSPRRDKFVNIFDENARSCNHILTIMNQLRDTSSCNLFTLLRSPRSPRMHAHTSRPRVQTDVQRFLQDTRHGLHDSTWISHARRAYRLSCQTELKVPVLIDLLDQILQSQPSAVKDAPCRWPSGVQHSPHPQQCAQSIDRVIRYGCQVKALNANMMNQHVEQLSLLLHQAHRFLGHQTGDETFDWFTSSVFIMCSGNIDRSRSILQRVAMLPTGSFVWPSLSQNTIQLTASIYQQLQALLAEYVPKAYNVLQEAGIPWWFVAERMTRQVYLPSMPVSQLPHIIALTALHSWEYHLYMHTAILAHIQPLLLDISSNRCILSLLPELKLDNFVIGDYLPFMDKLAKLNRPHLVRDRIATATL